MSEAPRPAEPAAPPTSSAAAPPGTFPLFNLAGISVRVHWSWLAIAMVELNYRQNAYTTQAFNIAEYLSLFLLVFLHECGHAFACRSVGGQAESIVLWPLGGVARLIPPPRPGALLWSIAAGPLVNLVLAVPLILLAVLGSGLSPDASHYLTALAVINVTLFVFNVLPIYPLDGGQMVRAVLWFFVGPTRSLGLAAKIGLVGAGGFLLLALYLQDLWLGIVGFYAMSRAWGAIKLAERMAQLEALPPPIQVAPIFTASEDPPPQRPFDPPAR